MGRKSKCDEISKCINDYIESCQELPLSECIQTIEGFAELANCHRSTLYQHGLNHVINDFITSKQIKTGSSENAELDKLRIENEQLKSQIKNLQRNWLVFQKNMSRLNIEKNEYLKPL